MSGAKGDALEWALALLRAPGERHVLRQRPLPQEGMELLLGIAAGATPDVLAEQARRFGASATQVLEAARFYAREVLFHPQADAYRVLGVETRASAEEIKAHYRLLQLWLHPDRAHDEDDAVFAARVNSAWNRLRSPERRQAYDEALRAQRPPEVFDSGDALRSVRSWVPAPEPVAPPSPWRRRLPALALLALCGVLVLLALRDMNRPDPDWEASPQVAGPSHAAAADQLVPLLLPAGQRPAPAQQVGPGEEPSAGSNLAVAAPPQQAAVDPPGGMYPQAEAAAPGFGAVQRVGGDTFQPGASPGNGVPAPARAAIPVTRAEAAPAVQRSQAIAAHPAVANTDATPAADPPSPTLQPEFTRVQSARLAGEQLLGYLKSPRRAAPPIWSSPAVEADAQRLRQRLHADGRARLAGARWRIGNNEAVLESAVAGAPARGDQLTAHLRWRDGYWLVTGVEMESIR